MQKIKQFIPWFLPSIGLAYLVVSKDDSKKFLLEILLLSVAVGGLIGMLLGVLEAIVERSMQLGVWTLAGSVFGCVLFTLGLVGLIVVLVPICSVLESSLYSIGISRSSSSDARSATAETVGLGFFVLLSPVALLGGAIVGGAIGGKLYYDRHQRRE